MAKKQDGKTYELTQTEQNVLVTIGNIAASIQKATNEAITTALSFYLSDVATGRLRYEDGAKLQFELQLDKKQVIIKELEDEQKDGAAPSITQ